MIRFRKLMIGVAALAAAGSATGQSAPPADPGTAQGAGAGATPADLIVAASADNGATAADPDAAESANATPPQPSPPKPHRAARVTTCRCGDPGQ